MRDFQSVIGRETKEQMEEREGRLPDTLVACIGGGSMRWGFSIPSLTIRASTLSVWKRAVTAWKQGEHSASLAGGSAGVLHGNRTYLLQDEDGQIEEGHSISAGLDYPGIGPEHAWLKETGACNM